VAALAVLEQDSEAALASKEAAMAVLPATVVRLMEVLQVAASVEEATVTRPAPAAQAVLHGGRLPTLTPTDLTCLFTPLYTTHECFSRSFYDLVLHLFDFLCTFSSGLGVFTAFLESPDSAHTPIGK